MSLEMNKVAAAILTGGIVAMLSGFVANELYSPEHLEEPAYKVALPEGGGGAKPEEPKEQSILPLLASASVEAGQKQTAKCAACHSFDKGGPTKVGPNLWGIVGSKPAEVAGYQFSEGMQKLEEEGKTWTYANLNDFLTSPKDFVPGTKMTFAGLKKIDQRADVIAYLRTLSDDPVPLPSKEEIEAAEGKSDAAAEKTEAEGSGETQTAAAGSETQTAAAGSETQTAAAGSETQTAAATEASGGGGSDLGTLLANASAEKGAKVARKCLACHTFEEGGANKVGPNLYNIIGEKAGEGRGYNFSKAMAAKGEEGYTWTYEHLDQYLANPKATIPGNKMTFVGLKKPEERADVIAYIRSLAKDPPPLPK